jgi:hypothetical protein
MFETAVQREGRALYLLEGETEDAWDNIRRTIKRYQGEAVKVLQPGGMVAIFTTTALAGARRLDLEGAKAELAERLDRAELLGAKRRVTSETRGWALTEDEKPVSGKWTVQANLGGRVDQADVRKVLIDFGVPFRTRIAGGESLWSVGWRFPDWWDEAKIAEVQKAISELRRYQKVHLTGNSEAHGSSLSNRPMRCEADCPSAVDTANGSRLPPAKKVVAA